MLSRKDKGMEDSQKLAQMDLPQWPLYEQTRISRSQQFIRSIRQPRFILHIMSTIAIVFIYIAIITFSARFSCSQNESQLCRIWWPLKLFLILWTAGAICHPGFASVGLMGGLFSFRRLTHILKHHGRAAWKAISMPLSILSTLAITLMMLVLYSIYDRMGGILFLSELFIFAFVGSTILQWLGATLYRLVGGSLVAINILFGFRLLLDDSSLPVAAMGIIVIIITAGIIVLLIKMFSPKKISIGMGRPPRHTSVITFPTADLKFGFNLSIFIIIIAAVGNAVADLTLPQKILSNKLAMEIIYFIGLLILIWVFTYFSRELQIFIGISSDLLAMRMSRMYCTVNDLSPGTETENFFKKLFVYSQQYTLMVIVGMITGIAICLMIFGKIGEHAGVILVASPLLVVYTTQFAYQVISSIKERFENTQPIYISDAMAIAHEIHSGAHYHGAAQFGFNDEQDRQLERQVIEYLSRTEEGQQVLIALRESGWLNDPRPLKLLSTILKYPKIMLAPAYGAFPNEIDWDQAVRIFFRDCRVLLLSLLITITLGAIMKQIFNFSKENTILLILGAMIPILLSMIADSKSRAAISTISGGIFKKLKSLRREAK
jgi:hypothetical protein